MKDNISVWDDAITDWRTWDVSAQSGNLADGLIAPIKDFGCS